MNNRNIPSDFTFRFAHTGDMVVSKQIQTVMGICQRIFHAIPERDIYNKDGYGLDIMARSRRTYQNGKISRDTEYEEMIMDQFTRFTDIIPSNVIVYIQNKTITVLMDAQYGPFKFQMRTSSDPTLSTEILPKEIRGI